ncbi:uncharacterized protein CLUP02_12591 [Colletotrichum lupini]|uniref:Uncharacterized protein n=1 Tax=Colletotrichum lupini TaxID=145971 RepID=A0A9Q8T0N6_9PEZI|nr:uncharacterized protein CLUP02_12591 [Colletotrichum lupini]UQC87089.1 hypothetical protein CLUP02_12591 [Colletotrichum lupini]
MNSPVLQPAACLNLVQVLKALPKQKLLLLPFSRFWFYPVPVAVSLPSSEDLKCLSTSRFAPSILRVPRPPWAVADFKTTTKKKYYPSPVNRFVVFSKAGQAFGSTARGRALPSSPEQSNASCIRRQPCPTSLVHGLPPPKEQSPSQLRQSALPCSRSSLPPPHAAEPLDGLRLCNPNHCRYLLLLCRPHQFGLTIVSPPTDPTTLISRILPDDFWTVSYPASPLLP